ncbi:MAG: N-acetylmuramoyl-L-alanine amidase [Actinomycetota bacterium]|nr:N-acetylmuramoyl-L-alanine amidase [Actinomycetota bacterium]
MSRLPSIRAWFVAVVTAVVVLHTGAAFAMLCDTGTPSRPLPVRATRTLDSTPAPRPRIRDDLIPYGARRRHEMARYSRRHYGRARWRLIHPKVIVLHFTGGNSYSSAWNTFASNTPELGELPGVCAHFIVGQRGTIYRLVPAFIRCRHTIGLNYTAIGIEMVQPTGAGSHWADQQILHRRRQIRAALRLVRWLRSRHHVRMRNVIGHAMANSSPLFKDLEGWRNTHTDWLRRDVKVFRRRLARMS